MPETTPIIPTTLRTWNQGTLNSVAANAENNFVVATKNNVHGVMIGFTGAADADLTRTQLVADVASIRAWLNGELVFDRTVTELLDGYKFHFDKYGALSAPLGKLPVSFMNHNLPIFDQRRGFALGMMKAGGGNNYNTLTMEVKMAGTVLTALKGEIEIITDVYPREVTGVHMRRLRTTRDLTATGWMNIPNLKTEYHGIAAMHVVDDNISRVQVTRDNEMVYKNQSYSGLKIMMDQAGRTPQTGYTHIPFDLSNDLHAYEGLQRDGVKDWDVEIYAGTAPGAGTVILTEEVHTTVKE